MSDLEKLKNQLTELIEGESAKARKQEEINSTNRILEGLHKQIEEAKTQLAAVQAEMNDVKTKATKEAEEIVTHANTVKASTEARHIEATHLERLAKDKLDDADQLRRQHESVLAEVTAQRDKLKAALA